MQITIKAAAEGGSFSVELKAHNGAPNTNLSHEARNMTIGPVHVGAISVNLDRTNVTDATLQPVCNWFRRLSAHGALICMPTYEECEIADSRNTYAENYDPRHLARPHSRQRAPFKSVEQCAACNANPANHCPLHGEYPFCLRYSPADNKNSDNADIDFSRAKYFRPKPNSHVIIPPLQIKVWW